MAILSATDLKTTDALLCDYADKQAAHDETYKSLELARTAIYDKLGVGHFIIGTKHVHVENRYTIRVDECKAVL